MGFGMGGGGGYDGGCGHGGGGGFDGSFILFLVLILLVFGSMPHGGYCGADK
ncbi:MAG: sporulation protein YjcZ [Actinobacteria bacterium]|nr:sporulation protein YjcZ [Actinomycetota bacterium]